MVVLCMAVLLRCVVSGVVNVVVVVDVVVELVVVIVDAAAICDHGGGRRGKGVQNNPLMLHSARRRSPRQGLQDKPDDAAFRMHGGGRRVGAPGQPDNDKPPTSDTTTLDVGAPGINGNVKGTAASDGEDYAAIVAHLSAAIEKNPDLAEPYRNRGAAPSLAPKRGGCRGRLLQGHCFSKAIERDPDLANKSPTKVGATPSLSSRTTAPASPTT